MTITFNIGWWLEDAIDIQHASPAKAGSIKWLDSWNEIYEKCKQDKGYLKYSLWIKRHRKQRHGYKLL